MSNLGNEIKDVKFSIAVCEAQLLDANATPELKAAVGRVVCAKIAHLTALHTRYYAGKEPRFLSFPPR
jgi:hypothetical protein